MESPEQHARVINNTEINNFLGTPGRDQKTTGRSYVRQGVYARAVHELQEALGDSPDDPEVHYYLALALLHGVRPNRLPTGLVRRACRHLESASSLPEAEVLRAVVNEDFGLSWHRYSSIPASLVALVASIDVESARELIAHVPALGTRSYWLLERKVASST